MILSIDGFTITVSYETFDSNTMATITTRKVVTRYNSLKDRNSCTQSFTGHIYFKTCLLEFSKILKHLVDNSRIICQSYTLRDDVMFQTIRVCRFANVVTFRFYVSQNYPRPI